VEENEMNAVEYCKSLNVGDKIKFRSEKQRFTVKAKSDRFLVCTKPFNLKKTCLYTIIDLDKMIRGADNYGGRYDYMIQDEINQCLADLELGDTEVSYRNYVQLDIEM
jgi:hypothetical protein